MPEAGNRFCDVAIPVPVDRLFTYALPETLEHRVKQGCRVVVPFGSRNLTGLVLRLHNDVPSHAAKNISKLVDEEPVLNEELIALGVWIAEYYCAPVGEVFRGMLPLAGESRKSLLYSLTEVGREAARQLTIASGQDAATEILRILDGRSRTASYLASKVQRARETLKSLARKGWVEVDEQDEQRDPFRAAAERLEVEFKQRVQPDLKLKKAEREFLAFLELHPGAHNLADLNDKLKDPSVTARKLARLGIIDMRVQQVAPSMVFADVPRTLNESQTDALAAIVGAMDTGYRAFLLQGVTGSGKTEVYLRAIDVALQQGKSALMLVPEIALTPAVAGQFFHRFAGRVAVLHSAFGDSERADQWRRVQSGQARVVIGTRSGVFAPIQDLGLVIVDEEHDGSYKQHESPRYNGRDVALVRSQKAGAVVVLGSATPSLESRFNAEQGKYTLLRMPERIGNRPMPRVELVDMRQEFLETRKQATFSRKLIEHLQQRLAAGEQSMLLLNRRGFSSFMVCRECGERMQCVNCAVVLTYHKRDRRMLCHYCGYAEKVPEECPKCGSDYIQFLGVGAERVEDELHQQLPTARIARLDRDTTSGKGAFETILQAFREGHIDVLVGTQMIAKGHDIPNVTLVGVVLADIGLSMPDFRAAERSFQLLTQAAGRAGRGDLPGEVIVQTLNPDHYAIRFAMEQDYEGFYKKELEFRKWLRYPPFAAFANIVVRDPSQEEALRLASEIGFLLKPQPEGVRVMGPAEAPVPRLLSEFRYQVLLKAVKRSVLRSVIQKIRVHAAGQKWKSTALVIDVDPISLM